MTLKHGRNGKRFFRAQQDPRGEWAAGTGGSAGFRPEQGVRFSQTKASTKAGTNGLPRHGAQPTRGANKAMKMAGAPRRYSGGPSILAVIQQNKKRR